MRRRRLAELSFVERRRRVRRSIAITTGCWGVAALVFALAGFYFTALMVPLSYLGGYTAARAIGFIDLAAAHYEHAERWARMSTAEQLVAEAIVHYQEQLRHAPEN